MSYSRWSFSKWYTYHSVYSGESKESQVFTICGDINFTYKDLTKDLDRCLSLVKKRNPNYTEEDFQELKEYMQQFIKSIDIKFITSKK